MTRDLNRPVQGSSQDSWAAEHSKHGFAELPILKPGVEGRTDQEDPYYREEQGETGHFLLGRAEYVMPSGEENAPRNQVPDEGEDGDANQFASPFKSSESLGPVLSPHPWLIGRLRPSALLCLPLLNRMAKSDDQQRGNEDEHDSDENGDVGVLLAALHAADA